METIYCPYRVCPLGAHVDHQYGLVTGFALDKGIRFDFETTEDGSISVFSKNYSGSLQCSLNNLPKRNMFWGDFLVGAVKTLSRKYQLTHGIRGEIEGSLPAGGLSSSAAVILTYLIALSRANGITLSRKELIENAVWEEQNYIGVQVGKLDQSCEIYSIKNHLLYFDTRNDTYELIEMPAEMAEFEIAVIFSGLERSLAASKYNIRVDECRAAAYALKAFCGMEYGRYQDSCLREVEQDAFEEYGHKLPENWYRRAAHYYQENNRVKEGIKVFRQGDIEKFGNLISKSGESSIYNYETGSRQLHFIQKMLRGIKGVYGGRFSGAGFNGSSIAIINPDFKEDIKEQAVRQYLKEYPELKNSFAIHFCKTADGVNLV